MNKIILLILCVLVSSCVLMRDPEPEYIQAAYATIGKHIRQQKQLGYSVDGNGGSMTTDVTELMISYEINKAVDISEARQRLVMLVESLLEIANNDSRLRPYMHCYPFTNKNAHISLSFNDKANLCLYPNVACVFNVNGMVYYSVAFDNTSPLETEFEEPYEEARRKVFGY